MPRNTLGPVKCHARKTNGDPCPKWAMRGQRVCYSHGGASPQAKAKADARIQAAVNPALTLIEEYLAHAGDPDYPVPAAVRLAAARDILDRAGYSATHRLEMSGDLTLRSPIDIELEELAGRLERLRGQEGALDAP